MLVDELRALTEFIAVLKGTDHDFTFAVDRARSIVRLLGSKTRAELQT
jgi:hypothetical protein